MAETDDIFTSSPMRNPLRLDRAFQAQNHFIANVSDNSPIMTREERRMARSATTGNTEVLGTPGNRNASMARHQIDGVDVQGIYPASSCVFVAK